MKKLFGVFLCIFILMFNTISVKAMDIGAAIDVTAEIMYNAWDAINAMFNGVVIQTSPYQGLANESTAMIAFYDDWSDHLLNVIASYPTADDPAISINYPIAYGMSGMTMNEFINEYGKIANGFDSFQMTLNGNTLAAWNRYNSAFIGRYLNAFRNDSIEVNPDLAYATQLEKLNGSYFSWKNYNYSYGNNTLHPIEERLPKDCTWVTSKNYSSFSSYMTYPSPIVTIGLNGSDNTGWTISYTGYSNSSYTDCGSNNRIMYNYNSGVLVGSNIFSAYYGSNFYSLSNFPTTAITLSAAFNTLANYFRNINIVVNGVVWAWVTQPDDNILAPDVIRSPEGYILGNDVIVPEQDLKVDLIGWQNLLEDKILTGDDITIDDVIDAGILTDAEGNIITDENRDEYLKKKDVTGIITDALDDSSAISLVPGLPTPPPIDPDGFSFPDLFPLPDGELNPRDTGLSVLARIVNMTNKSVPSELMTLFWGIATSLLILGIIKIMHK